MRNLIDNALRYTGRGRSDYAVRAMRRPTARSLEVADTGIGIPPEELPRIFDRFYRVEKSRSLGDGSAGLGLAIAKGILDLHGSTIA